MGLVSLLADVTYEGARSIVGPYLAILGASATAVGVVAGAGELIGQALRLLTGLVADRTRRYWAFTLAGYAINLLAVPLLALAGSWEMAAGLILAERLGKAIRTPARDVLLSAATRSVGAGWGFGLHEAMDQIGAVAGPILLAGVLTVGEGYRTAFALLLVPALLALTTVAAARWRYPEPSQLDDGTHPDEGGEIGRRFWIYLLAVGLVAAGFADFPLVAFHLKTASVASDEWIPLLYALAMGVDALSALLFGRWFDRRGLGVLALAAGVSAAFAPLVFLGGFGAAAAGMVLWGVGLGAQESIMKAAVAVMVREGRRGTAYGLLNGGYGLLWFAGSALMGVLYDTSLGALVVFSVAAQLMAVPLFLLVARSPSR